MPAGQPFARQHCSSGARYASYLLREISRCLCELCETTLPKENTDNTKIIFSTTTMHHCRQVTGRRDCKKCSFASIMASTNNIWTWLLARRFVWMHAPRKYYLKFSRCFINHSTILYTALFVLPNLSIPHDTPLHVHLNPHLTAPHTITHRTKWHTTPSHITHAW